MLMAAVEEVIIDVPKLAISFDHASLTLDKLTALLEDGVGYLIHHRECHGGFEIGVHSTPEWDDLCKLITDQTKIAPVFRMWRIIDRNDEDEDDLILDSPY